MSFSIKYAKHMDEIPSNPIFDLMPKLNEPGFISFAAGVPSPQSFPYDELLSMSKEALEESAKILFQYGSTEGYPPLRESAAALFQRAGIAATSDEVFVSTGGQQTIDLLCKLLLVPGDKVLVETPTYSATLQIISTYQAVPIGIESDDEGILIDDLEKKIKEHNPRFVYIIPNFQNPSGQTLSLERRKELARITAEYDVLLIEDDPYRELRYFGEHIATIKSLDEYGNVVYMTSTSKILCPGLRVGVTHVAKGLKEHLIVSKQAADMHSPNLTQAIVDKFLRSGLLDAHLDKIRTMYRERVIKMVQAMDEYMPEEVKHTNPQGGLFIWCEMPKHVNTTALLPKAVEQKVAFIPGDQFFAQPSINNFFRLNFSNASLENIEHGIKILGGLLKQAL